MKIKRTIMILTVGLLLVLSGCHKEPEVDGGTTDKSDPNAPKKIESKDIESFRCFFYSENELNSELSGNYDISLTRNGDLFDLEESDHFKLKESVDKDVADGIFRIIDKYGLAAYNGTDKITAGLPAEYGPMLLSAFFESGESLYFHINGDPDTEWTRELVKYIRDAFIAKGHDELKPAEKVISNYYISFNYNGPRYSYFFIANGDAPEMIARRVNQDNTEADFAMEAIPQNYTADLQDIIESCELERFHSGSIADVDTTKLYSGDFYEIYIDYTDGTQIYGYSNDGSKLDQFRGIRDELFYRLDSFFPYAYQDLISEDEIASLRQNIFDSGCAVGVAYLGRVEGPIGDGIINVIEGTPYEEWTFLTRIPFDNYVETDGFDYFLIIPLENNSSVKIADDKGNIIFEESIGNPILLCCNGDSGNVKVTVSAGFTTTNFNIALKSGKLQPAINVRDLSIH